MTQHLTVDLTAPTGNLSEYMAAVGQVPRLSKDEEYALATQIQEKGDVNAARRLIMANLKFVIYITKSFSGYELPREDLIQEGNIGLMKAVKRFDPNKGVRLASFAVHWIKAEIYDYIVRAMRVVKLVTTKAQRKMFFNLNKIYKSRGRGGRLNQAEVEKIAEELSIPETTVRQMMDRMASRDVAFDGNQGDDVEIIEDLKPTPAGYLKDTRTEPLKLVEKEDSEEYNRTQLIEALENLNEREYDIISSRWLSEDKPTLKDLAAKWGVSHQRIKQIEVKTLKKMRGVFLA